MNLAMEPLEGYQVESEAGRAVALALELDEGLVREGVAREIVRAVQNARKESGLEITDRIELHLSGDAELLAAARAHEQYVGGETLAEHISYTEDGLGGAASTRIDGRDLVIVLQRVEAPE
jgi:isoleucyl-tRNA synthetase